MSSFNNRIPLLSILCLILLHQVEVCYGNLMPQPLPIRVPGAGAIENGARAIENGAEAVKKALPSLPTPHQPILGPEINCKENCYIKCKEAPRYKACFRVCNTCCQRCNCVQLPGNNQACPCWDTIVHRGRKRCP